MSSTGVTWLASFPKSGNTWLRCLLDAYRRNGLLDINDIQGSTSDGGAILYEAVAPQRLEGLGWRGQMLLRPAALMHMFVRQQQPVRCKTHSANLQPKELPPLIPKEITHKAVYIVRDPRAVALSVMRFFGMPLDATIECMGNKDWLIGGNETFAFQFISSWSNHARSWIGEKDFPIHVVRYEDLWANAAKELTEVLEFLDEEVDEERVKRAVEASSLNKVRKQEAEKGFKEHQDKNSRQFFSGSTNWKEDLGPTWVKRIEQDHGDLMSQLGYELEYHEVLHKSAGSVVNLVES